MKEHSSPDDAGRATRWLAQDFSTLVEEIDAREGRKEGPVVFDLVVVGSGYGGAMTAAEMAGCREGGRLLRIAVLERGREYLPGSFPSAFAELAGNVRVGGVGREPLGPREGLFDLRVGPHVSALVGNGLGGTSLINASVMKAPDDAALAACGFDETTRRELQALFPQVKGRLGALGNTIDLHPVVQAKPLPKREALDRMGRRFGVATESAELTVEMSGTRPNGQGVRLPRCTLCGDCMTGCNVGARKSLDTNLLVQARQRGAEIYTGVSVLRLERDGGHWSLDVAYTDRGLHAKRGGTRRIRARRVVLAAGTFGSTELLLRSTGEGQRFSPRLGEGFSCNGDNLLAVQGEVRVDTVAHESQPLVAPEGAAARHVGPTITGMFELQPEGAPRFLVQEFAVPAPLRRLFGEVVTTGRLLQDLALPDRTTHGGDDSLLDPFAVDDEAVRCTSLLGLIGHDAARGRLKLPRDAGAAEGMVQVEWKEAARDPAVVHAFRRVQGGLEDPVIPNPLWQLLPDSMQRVLSNGPIAGSMVTVHPLGGCCIGNDWRDGVVDGHGRVFGVPGNAHDFGDSLLVLDGAIVPGSLGANPALTIATLALRACRHWKAQWGWDDGAPGVPVVLPPRPVFRSPNECVPPPARATQMQLIERLSGRVPLRANGSPAADYFVELTLGYEPLPLAHFTERLGRRMQLLSDADGELDRLRVYAAEDWPRLSLLPEAERAGHALLEARLTGELRFLHREASSHRRRAARAWAAWAVNRGLRDVWQHNFDAHAKARRRVPPPDASGRLPAQPSLIQRAADWWGRLLQSVKLATRAGEVRRFDYRLEVAEILSSGAGAPLLRVGDGIHGQKRLTYSCGGNPFNQLLYLQLTRFPHLPPGDAPLLKLDGSFLARQGVPLMRVTDQENQPTALAELASFAAYGVRLLLGIHLWSFRAPDVAEERPAQRLPGPLPGLPVPEIHELDVGEGDAPVRARLTRYRGAGEPLVMIHGYSASGTTFAHPALPSSMAAWFWKRGRDIWILDLRTSSGMPTARHPWAFEEVAEADIPLAIAHVARLLQAERGEPVAVDVFAHCIGAAMLSMALLMQPTKAAVPLHTLVRRVVLSQKGPAFAYSDANMLRAYILSYLKPLLPTRYSFRPSLRPSAGEDLLDRVLAAMPYPHDEFRHENPRRPWRRTAWTATRHRMDALYEHTFRVANMSREVLERLDDFFGPLSLETVTQTIHFARHRAITDRHGRNTFLTRENFSQWPTGGTLLLHAEHSGLVNPASRFLVDRTLREAGVPFECKLLEGMGHQDCLIGMTAERTFEVVDAFLQKPAPAVLPPAHELRIAPPWLGPRVQRAPASGQLATTLDGASVKVAAGEHFLTIAADPARPETVAFLVPVLRQAGRFQPLPGPYRGAPVTPYAGWVALDLPVPLPDCDGVLVLTTAGFDTHSEWELLKSSKAATPFLHEEQVQRELAAGDARWEEAFVPLSALQPAPRPEELRLAVASCQYPAGILDGAVAQASLHRLAARAGQLDAVLMLGDQIYADATAGLLDPVRLEDRYGHSHEQWLRMKPLREVMRRVPVHVMLDDHELADNWEPGVPCAGQQGQGDEADATALDAWWRYQRGSPPGACTDPRWYRVAVGEFEIFMADTRSERGGRPQDGRMFQDAQFEALVAWLAEQQQHDVQAGVVRPKFLACSTWLFPDLLGNPEEAEHSLRVDGWQGYPATRERLLAHLVDQQIEGLVVLAGDAHMAARADIELALVGQTSPPIHVQCINAPAMYAPFPFANAKPHDFLREREFTFGGGRYRGHYLATWGPRGDGFAQVCARRVGSSGRWSVDVVWETGAA